jgi:hypothetical protein
MTRTVRELDVELKAAAICNGISRASCAMQSPIALRPGSMQRFLQEIFARTARPCMAHLRLNAAVLLCNASGDLKL